MGVCLGPVSPALCSRPGKLSAALYLLVLCASHSPVLPVKTCAARPIILIKMRTPYLTLDQNTGVSGVGLLKLHFKQLLW